MTSMKIKDARDAVSNVWYAIADDASRKFGRKKNAAFAMDFDKADQSGYSRRERRDHSRMSQMRKAMKPTQWM